MRPENNVYIGVYSRGAQAHRQTVFWPKIFIADTLVVHRNFFFFFCCRSHTQVFFPAFRCSLKSSGSPSCSRGRGGDSVCVYVRFCAAHSRREKALEAPRPTQTLRSAHLNVGFLQVPIVLNGPEVRAGSAGGVSSPPFKTAAPFSRSRPASRSFWN